MRRNLARPTSNLLLIVALCALAGCGRNDGASLYADGQSAYQAKDFAKAAALYERACVAGEVRACTSLGTMAVNGEGGRKDASWARGLFEKACKGGDPEGCEKLRSLTAKGPAPQVTLAAPQAIAPQTATAPTAASTPDTTSAPLTAHPSFDCATAHNEAERLICSDDGLARRDVELARLYRRARDHAVDESAVIAEQRDWMALRRNACTSKECLYRVYAHRERELEDWLP